MRATVELLNGIRKPYSECTIWFILDLTASLQRTLDLIPMCPLFRGSLLLFILYCMSNFFCRSTAFGIQAVFGRIGAILGNLSFGQLKHVDPMIPILIVAAFLLIGGVSAIFLPSIPGEGTFQSLNRKCHRCLCWPFRKLMNIQYK